MPTPCASDDALDAEAAAAIPLFARFARDVETLKLDGFLLERRLPQDRPIDGNRDAPEPFGLYNLSLWLRASLDALSRLDPTGDGSTCIIEESPHGIGGVATSQRGWRFRFAGMHN